MTSVTVFRVLPRANKRSTHSWPPSLSPHLYNISTRPCLPPLTSLFSRRVGLCANYCEHPSRRPIPDPLTSPEKSISVPSVLYRRAQISSQVCIKRPHLDLSSSSLIFFSGQPHLPFCAIRPFAFSSPFISPRHSLLPIFVRN